MRKGLLIVLINIVLLFGIQVSAATKPTINSVVGVEKDIVKVTATQGDYPIVKYLVGKYVESAEVFDVSTSNALNPYLSVPNSNGEYKIWAIDSNGTPSNPYSYRISTSCSMEGLYNVTGSGKISMCGMMDYLGNVKYLPNYTNIVTCASGYHIDTFNTTLSSTTCVAGRLSYSAYNIGKRFCEQVYNYSCVKDSTTPNPGGSTSDVIPSALDSLSLSSGTLSPSFQSGTTYYTATVNASSVTINATKRSDKATFVDGYGPRTVNLNYGKNTFEIRVKGSKESVYTIVIERPAPSLSSVNTLSSLSISTGSISPSFSPNINNYSAFVTSSVASVNIFATLSDGNSSFVDGYGPRTVTLNTGNNAIPIKVRSQSGHVRTYTITINKAAPIVVDPNPNPNPTPGGEEEPPSTQSEALLKNITLSSGLIAFEPRVFDYNVTVDNSVTNILVTVEQENSSDIVTINGGADLQVGANEITIEVASADGSVKNVYTLYVIRKEAEETISSNSLLKDLVIKGHDIKFDAKVTEYEITLDEQETELEIEVTAASDRASVSIEGNEQLTTGSEVKIRVTAESGDYTDYYIKITGYRKSSNIFVTIIIIIIIVLILAYLVLRLLGYRIYFNVSGIKNYFSNLFSRKK